MCGEAASRRELQAPPPRQRSNLSSLANRALAARLVFEEQDSGLEADAPEPKDSPIGLGVLARLGGIYLTPGCRYWP